MSNLALLGSGHELIFEHDIDDDGSDDYDDAAFDAKKDSLLNLINAPVASWPTDSRTPRILSIALDPSENSLPGL